jgi:hypothetical protein
MAHRHLNNGGAFFAGITDLARMKPKAVALLLRSNER